MLQRVVVDPAKIQPPIIQLTPEQHHYLQRVLRLKSGDRFIALDGQGNAWLAMLNSEDAQILEPMQTHTELPIVVTLVIALPKGNAFDEVVRQVTELGVAQILPVISDRTLLNPSPQKCDRWRRIAQEAAEQSERQIVPKVFDPVLFTAHLEQFKQLPQPVSGYLCTPRDRSPHLLTVLLSSPSPTQLTPCPPPALHLATGPEGGWTEAEVEQAIAAGYQAVSLGDRILRAVTAPIAGISLIAAIYERESRSRRSQDVVE
jgi:16S rRNA (uracil1498-N3)-methyltransferase